MVGAGGQGRLAAHGHGVDADDRVRPGGEQAPQGELADDAQAEHGRRAAEREAGADGRAQAVAGDAGDSAAFSESRSSGSFHSRPRSWPMVSSSAEAWLPGIADAVAGLPAA